MIHSMCSYLHSDKVECEAEVTPKQSFYGSNKGNGRRISVSALNMIMLLVYVFKDTPYTLTISALAFKR